MMNILASSPEPEKFNQAKSGEIEPGLYLHMYNKAENKPGRKMGHITCVGDTIEETKARAEALHAQLTDEV